MPTLRLRGGAPATPVPISDTSISASNRLAAPIQTLAASLTAQADP